MKLFPKDKADELYQKGAMPEWWYRQHYKTAEENELEHLRQWAEYSAQILEERRKEREEQAAIDKTVEKAIDIAFQKYFK